jgi:cytochrome c oxidase subunit 4
MTETQTTHYMQAPHVSWTKYVGVAVVLGVITAIEVALSFILRDNPGLASLIVPVLIAFTLTKAGLVMAFYMHLKYDTRWYSMVLIFPFFMVVLLFGVVIVAAANWVII